MRAQLIICFLMWLVWVYTAATGTFTLGTMSSSITFTPEGTFTLDAMDEYISEVPYLIAPIGLLVSFLWHFLFPRQKPTSVYYKGAL